MEQSVNVLYNLSGLLSLFNAYFSLAKINHVPLTLTEVIYAIQTVNRRRDSMKMRKISI